MSNGKAIDAHLHLWEKQNGQVNGRPVVALSGGKSNFGGEIRQMMPPDFHDGTNTVERLLANMDYALVNGCVVTQEVMDGNQDLYLLEAKRKNPERIKICSLYEENDAYRLDGFDGLKICACKLKTKKLSELLPVFCELRKREMFLSIDLMDGDLQTETMKELLSACGDLRVAIGHFGMVTTRGWEKQIELAAMFPKVYIESGGLTWLFNAEGYPFPSAIKAIREAISICGVHKLMWGSDYPRTMTEITYKMSVQMIRNSKELSEKEKEAFLFENAVQFYGFSKLTEMKPIKNML